MSRPLEQKSEEPDRRAFMRVPMATDGKIFFPQTGDEMDCFVREISLLGASLSCFTQLAIRTELVLYVPGFDRFEATVAWSKVGRCGVAFHSTPAKRERTALKIMQLLSGALQETCQTRRAERIAVPAPRSFVRPDGEVVNFVLLDISLTGASLKTASRPPLGEKVMVGSSRARVTRHFDEGIALQFERE